MALRAVQRIRDHVDGRATLILKSRLEWQLAEIAFPDLAPPAIVASEFAGSKLRQWASIAGALRRLGVTHAAGLHLRDSIQNRAVVQLSGASSAELNAFDPYEGRHKVDQYAAIADRVTGSVSRHTPFRLEEFVTERADEIVLAPGSGILEAHKRWPAKRYAELIDLLHSRDASTRFVLLGAPNERELLDSIAAAAKSRDAVRIVAGVSVRESLALLGRARAVIGGCSGSLHLAALVDAPIVGVYGPTNPGWTGPSGSIVRIVRNDFECSACYAADFIRGCGDPQCMSSVAAGVVANALEEMELGKGPNELPWLPLSKLRVARRRGSAV